MSSETPERISLLNSAIAIGMGVVLTILIAEAVLRAVFPGWREFDAARFTSFITIENYGILKIGKPGFDGYFSQNNGDFRTHIKINQFGLRNPEPIEKAGGRIWIIGDSMAFGWGIEQNEIYSEVIQKTLGIQTYNLAAPGNDICGYQKMAARIPAGLRPKAVIVGLILENDVKDYDCRALFRQFNIDKPAKLPSSTSISRTRIKVFLTRSSATYNFIAVSLKRIGVVKNFLIKLGLVSKEHEYRQVVAAEKIDDLIVRVAMEMTNLRKMVPSNIPFAVLIAPTRFELKFQDPVHRTLRKKMISALKNRNIAVIDPHDAFAQAGFEAVHFQHDGHWSKRGHEIAAGQAVDWLRTYSLTQGVKRPDRPGEGK